MYFRTEAKIDLDALEYNLNNIKAKLSADCKLLGVMKADAYGHGAVEIAKHFGNEFDFIGAASIEEAMAIKNAGVKAEILILGYVSPNYYDIVVENEIRIPIFSMESAKALSNEAVKQNKTVPFHFCVDTGMSRIGFQVNEESADICKEICNLPNIKAEGLFSHYATADCKDLTKANAQRERFDSFIKMLEDRDITIPVVHISNSAGLMNFDKQYDMCRAGIVIYGLYPSDEVDKSLLDIKPVMSWTAHISHIKTLEENREISYGGTYVTAEPRMIATVPVGYADGYPRSLSNKGRVIINGQYANIVGRVCMDQFMVDVTDIPDVKVDDVVTLVGVDGDAVLTMEEVSDLAGSFNYELPCRITRRVPRTYYKNGKFINYTIAI